MKVTVVGAGIMGSGIAYFRRRLLGALPWVMTPALLQVGCEPGAVEPVYFVDQTSSAEASFNVNQHRSIRKDDRLSASITMGGETRRSLTPPLPSDLTFPVRVPTDAVLRFAIGIKTLRGIDRFPKVSFRLAVHSPDGPQTLFEERLGLGKVDRWIEREVDLGSYSGSSVELSFETKMQPGVRATPGVVGGILPLWGNPVLSGNGGETQPPNLILISLDCVRPDHVGAYGYSRDTTPNIDRFAEEGVVFETAVATAASTLPSHVSMFTGLPPSLHGASNWEGLPGSVPYLPELLSRIGYESDAVASTLWLSKDFGVDRGFHVFRTSDNPRADRVLARALDLLKRAKDRPQFLFVHLYDAHWPYSPPREFIERFGKRPTDISGLLGKVDRGELPSSPKEIEQIISLYDAEIAYADREVGKFLDALKQEGLYDKSLIAIVSDHGEAFWEHGHWTHSVSVYEEVIRVVLIVKWPGDSPRGRVASQVSLVDIFATLLEQAEHPERTKIPTQSVDLLQYLTGSRDEPKPRFAISEIIRRPKPTTPPGMKISFRDDEFKYIATLNGSKGDPNPLAVHHMREEELYRLATDPREQKNLIKELASEAQSYRRALRAHLEEARALRATREGRPLILDEDLKERLRSLGYTIY